MYTIILNENLEEIDKFYFNKNLNYKNLKKIRNIPKVEEVNKKFMDKINYFVGVYYPAKNSDDFHIIYLNKIMEGFCSFNLEDIEYAYISEVFLENNNLLKNMNEVYNSGNPQRLIGEYHNSITYNRFMINIFKLNGFIYTIGKYESDYSSLSYEQEVLFNNNVNGIAVTQNNYFVKCNKKCLELHGFKNYEEIIGKRIDFSEYVDKDTIKAMQKYTDKILKERLISYKTFLEFKKDGKLFHYFDLESSYIIYNHKPAILSIYNDITEQELTRRKLTKKEREAEILQKNMDFIQSVSNTCSAYVINKEIIRSPKLYEMLERDPNEEDPHRDILWDIVVEEDRHILEENYARRTPENTFVDFIIRINTAKGNLKYLHCYMKDKYMENNRRDVVSFYQDVTAEQLHLKNLIRALNTSQKYQRQLNLSLKEKDKLLKDREMLLAEVHHRVKNNLQIVLSLINLNKEYESDPNTILDNTENRIYAMALLHEKIYGSESLSDVNIKEYIESLVNSLLELYSSNIQFNSDIEPNDFNMEQAIPLGLIINELTLNTIKYAFPNTKTGNLDIKFKKEGKHCILTIQDDGIGLPEHLNFNNLTNLGLIVVQNLTLQIGGTISMLKSKGTGFKIEFNIEE